MNQCLIHFSHKSEKSPKSTQYLQSESVLIHPKMLTRKSESVLIHSEKISPTAALPYSYIIVNPKTNNRNIQNQRRICQTESSKYKNEIWTYCETAQIGKHGFVQLTKAGLTKNGQVINVL